MGAAAQDIVATTQSCLDILYFIGSAEMFRCIIAALNIYLSRRYALIRSIM